MNTYTMLFLEEYAKYDLCNRGKVNLCNTSVFNPLRTEFEKKYHCEGKVSCIDVRHYISLQRLKIILTEKSAGAPTSWIINRYGFKQKQCYQSIEEIKRKIKLHEETLNISTITRKEKTKMIKPNNYDNVSLGEFTPVELGGHHAIIKQVNETKSKTGKDMLVVLIDFAEDDKQPHYFMDSFEDDIRPDKKWSYQATQYIVATDNNGNTSRSFKSFITSFENSNNTTVTWGNNFATQFKGKKIGVVYGNVEEAYNGKMSKRRRIRWFCDDNKVAEQKVPEDKLLDSTVQANNNSWLPEAGVDEEIPF